MTASTNIIATRRLRDGRRATLTRCTHCGQRCWRIGADPRDCGCALERGGGR